jgi:hypothetical protein
MEGLVVSDTDKAAVPSHVKFRYIKSNYFRVVHVDGAFGGFSPQGKIFVSMFSERPPLPDATFQTVEGGVLGKELVEHRQAGDEGVVRELEVGLAMDVSVAKGLVDWLNERIEIAEKIQSNFTSQEILGKK